LSLVWFLLNGNSHGPALISSCAVHPVFRNYGPSTKVCPTLPFPDLFAVVKLASSYPDIGLLGVSSRGYPSPLRCVSNLLSIVLFKPCTNRFDD